MNKNDLLLYVIIDIPSLEKLGLSLSAYAESLLQAGVKVLQLRDKRSSVDVVKMHAETVLSLTKAYKAAFFLNDYAGLAAEIGADGVHVGQSDTAVSEVKRCYPDLLVGASARTIDSAQRAEREGAAYIGCGPIWDAASSKVDAFEPIGLEQLERVACSVQIPVVGIGGISALNAVHVIGAKASGIAVIRETLPAQQSPSLKDLEVNRSKVELLLKLLQDAQLSMNEKREIGEKT